MRGGALNLKLNPEAGGVSAELRQSQMILHGGVVKPPSSPPPGQRTHFTDTHRGTDTVRLTTSLNGRTGGGKRRSCCGGRARGRAVGTLAEDRQAETGMARPRKKASARCLA